MSSNAEKLREALLGVERAKGWVKTADLIAMAATGKATTFLNRAEENLRQALAKAEGDLPRTSGPVENAWAASTDSTTETPTRQEMIDLIKQGYEKTTGRVPPEGNVEMMPDSLLKVMYPIYKRALGG